MSADAKSPDDEIRVLLVDDQAMVAEAVSRMLAGEEDIRFQYCQDPAEAIATAEAFRPTVVLLDLVMPDVDGLTLARFFQANTGTAEVPLIVLSTKEEPTTKAEAFELGASDYLVKLPDRIELVARIRHHSMGYIRLLQRNAVQEKLLNELAEAAHYVETLLPGRLTEGPVLTDWNFVPSESLGGDAFGYHFLEPDRFAMYLIDVCGHGVGAALLSVSVMNVLRSQSLPNVDFLDPAGVLAALNEAFDMDRQNGMYFTAWYGVFDTGTRKLTYASGGHPPALMFAPGGGEPARLATKNTVIGAMPGLPFQKDEVAVPPDAHLYIYSDGVYEITLEDGRIWTLDEFADFISQPPPQGATPITGLLNHVRELARSEILDDDFSIVEVGLP